MFYELTAAIKTIRNEGLRSFIAKLRHYIREVISGCLLFGHNKAAVGLSPKDLTDFSFNEARGMIAPSQKRSEIIALLELLQKDPPKTVVEIGTANGGTLFLFSRSADPQGTIISIDLPNGIHGGGYPLWKTLLYKRFAGKQQTLHLVRANSRDPKTIDKIKSILGGKTIDFLFIDGDHTYDGVKSDFENYSPLVSKSGMMAFHDICEHAPEQECHVDIFWREISPKFRSREFVEDQRQGWGGIGILFMS